MISAMKTKLNKESIDQIIFENNLFKRVMDELIQGVYITDDEEKIIWMNTDIETSDAKKRKNVIGKSEADVYGAIGRFHRHTTQTGQPIPMRLAHYYLPDGRRTDVIMTTQPYFEKDKLKAVFTVGFNLERLQNLVRTTINLRSPFKLKKTSRSNRTNYTFDDIIGKSETLKSTIKMAKKAALSNSNIMINGETGTGKELIAQSIHNASQRANGQFVAINCAAIPETLLESLLFGTSKGAFTGALESPGLFELANGGSLFLDEINSMPLILQTKLLRVLQEKEVQRLGEQKLRPIDCRVISATNIDPLIAVRNKVLRDDIYFRLAAITIYLPPLRVRTVDIPVLSSYFLQKLKPNLHGQKMISQSALDLMKSYSWPGNVREMEHALEYALTMMEADEALIEKKHLPPHILTCGLNKAEMNCSRPEMPSINSSMNSLPQALFEYETALITNALARNKGHLTKTANELGVSRQTLSNRIKRLKIEQTSVKVNGSGHGLQ